MRHGVLAAITGHTIVVVLAFACDERESYVPPVKHREAEVSPGTFASFDRWDWTVDDVGNKSGLEKTRLRIEYGAEVVEWEGVDIPVVLREKDGRLYMAGYDRETGRRAGDSALNTFHYFRQDGDRLIEIARDEFPKELATQNLWLNDPHVLRAVLNLDTSDVKFRHSTNAALWRHLMTGRYVPGPVSKETLDEFAERYQPVRLTAIKRSDPDE